MSEVQFIVWFLVVTSIGKLAFMLWFEWKAWLRRRDNRRREYVMPGSGSSLYPWNRAKKKPDRIDNRSYRDRLKDL